METWSHRSLVQPGLFRSWRGRPPLPAFQPLGTSASPRTNPCSGMRASAWGTWVVTWFGRAQLLLNETENISQQGFFDNSETGNVSHMPRPPALFLPAIALCHALRQARPAPSPLLQMRSLRQRGKRRAPPASRRGGARSRSRFASPRPALRHSHAAHRCVGGRVFVTRWHAAPACCPGGGSHTFQPRESGSVSPHSSPQRVLTTKNSSPIC